MSYAVKEMFLTLQGEGVNAGARRRTATVQSEARHPQDNSPLTTDC